VAKQILYKEEARRALEEGIDIMVEAVAVTLGPRGRNVVIEKKYGLPQIINDGVSIAKEVVLNNNMQNTGVCLVRQAALKTNEVAGDGTTTSTVLAHAIIREGMKHLAAGASPISLKIGIDLATKFVIQKINDIAKPVENLTSIAQVAALSAGNDSEVGNMIADALGKVGKDGIISLEEGKSTTTELDIAEGLMFEKGFISPYFINQPDKREVIFENPYILITDKKITLVQQELIPILEQIKGTNRPLLIIADNIAQEALATLVLNNLRGTLNIASVRAPSFGDLRKFLLQDIAVLTGSTLITEDTGLTLKNVKLTSFGEAKKVIITENSTSIITTTTSEQITTHCEMLRKQMNLCDGPYEKQQFQDRIAKLSGGVAVIKVGAITETEMKEKKLRLEDAINATKAAIDEGVVPGGGTLFIHLSGLLKTWAKNNLYGDELIGAFIIADAITYPFHRIAKNAGKNGHIIIDALLQESLQTGYDALNENIIDMFESGIIDPAKVTRSSLQNAASISSMILTTECVIVENRKA
jgi:chaperonin GroEL